VRRGRLVFRRKKLGSQRIYGFFARKIRRKRTHHVRFSLHNRYLQRKSIISTQRLQMIVSKTHTQSLVSALLVMSQPRLEFKRSFKKEY